MVRVARRHAVADGVGRVRDAEVRAARFVRGDGRPDLVRQVRPGPADGVEHRRFVVDVIRVTGDRVRDAADDRPGELALDGRFGAHAAEVRDDVARGAHVGDPEHRRAGGLATRKHRSRDRVRCGRGVGDGGPRHLRAPDRHPAGVASVPPPAGVGPRAIIGADIVVVVHVGIAEETQAPRMIVGAVRILASMAQKARSPDVSGQLAHGLAMHRRVERVPALLLLEERVVQRVVVDRCELDVVDVVVAEERRDERHQLASADAVADESERCRHERGRRVQEREACSRPVEILEEDDALDRSDGLVAVGHHVGVAREDPAVPRRGLVGDAWIVLVIAEEHLDATLGREIQERVDDRPVFHRRERFLAVRRRLVGAPRLHELDCSRLVDGLRRKGVSGVAVLEAVLARGRAADDEDELRADALEPLDERARLARHDRVLPTEQFRRVGLHLREDVIRDRREIAHDDPLRLFLVRVVPVGVHERICEFGRIGVAAEKRRQVLDAHVERGCVNTEM
mmetsp:Transcript_25046/g.80931  ORF Transcript_25046/g.80931 Transcript_25046/m.80931 type:complete len:512 (-) Transcript_25046:77-1612(-)